MYEVEGLPDSDPDDEFYPNAKKPSRVKFSSSPIKVGPHKLCIHVCLTVHLFRCLFTRILVNITSKEPVGPRVE